MQRQDSAYNMNFSSKEIMYRAWDVKEQTMHYYCPISSFNGVVSTNGKSNTPDVRSYMTWKGKSYSEGSLQKIIYLQGILTTKCDEATAIKDKYFIVESDGHGNYYKWIFEGDILKFTEFDDDEVIGLVMWNPSNSSFILKDINNINYCLFSNKEYEIIGNIFENPKLLENEQI